MRIEQREGSGLRNGGALAQRASYNALVARAGTIKDSAATAVGETAVTPDSGATAGPAAAPTQAEKAAPQAEAPRAGSGEPATDSQKRSLKSVVDSAKEVSKQVIALGSRGSGSNAAVLQNNANNARKYNDYLDTLSNSMRGSRTKAEADDLIANANRTRAFLNQMLAESKAALK